MVLVPTLTMESPLLFVEVIAEVALAVFLVTGASVLVEICEVTVSPLLFVVVTSTVVGMELLDGGAC